MTSDPEENRISFLWPSKQCYANSLSQHGNFSCKCENVNKKTGLVAYLRADPTLQIIDLHLFMFSKDFLSFYMSGLSLHPAIRG